MNKIFAVGLSLLLTSFIYAQKSSGGFPYGLGKPELIGSIQGFRLSPINNQALLQEDEILAAQGEKSLRFGIDVPVNISPSTHGTWTTLPNNMSVWTLRIKSDGALGLNFIFDQFFIPEGAKLFIYSSDGSLIQGAYTSDNINKIGNFATLPIAASEVILEYSLPTKLRTEDRFHLNYIIHNYRSFNTSLKDFGQSGSCNNNVVCPEGDAWSDQIRSAVMMLSSNNSRFCSGAAVNNTANDGTPYVLTANHCTVGPTDIFMFNYQSPNCSPSQDGPTTDVVVGCTPRANNAGSDFALVELSESIPAEFNAYLSGWSRQEEVPANATVIHHPDGDVKKISFNTDATGIAQWSGANCWQIFDWEDGTTEPGSSGSPLYNENHQIIGQLYGGDANCNNNVNDYFGRFGISWDGNQANKRLKDWLDPSNSDVASIDGLDASVPTLQVDARLQTIVSPVSEYCNESSFIPEIKVRNSGIQTLTTFTVEYSFNGGAIQQFNWQGSLATNQITNVQLPVVSLNTGANQLFTANIINPNGTSDELPANNQSSISVTASQGKPYSLRLVSDNYPEETSWYVQNVSTNEILYSAALGTVAQGTTDKTFCLPVGCYKFIIEDEFNDGICCGFFSGNGSYTIYDDQNTVLGTGGQFSDSASVSFCVTGVGIKTIDHLEAGISMFPNPANHYLTMKINEDILNLGIQLEVLDVQGRIITEDRIIQSTQNFNTTILANGIYVFRFVSPFGIANKRVIISH